MLSTKSLYYAVLNKKGRNNKFNKLLNLYLIKESKTTL